MVGALPGSAAAGVPDVTLIPEQFASRAGLAWTRERSGSGSMERISESLASRPVLVIPIAVTSNSSGSSALMTDAADVNDISCSPDLPPKIIPSLVFRPFAIIAVSLREDLFFRVLLIGLNDQAHEVVPDHIPLIEVAESQPLHISQNRSCLYESGTPA